MLSQIQRVKRWHATKTKGKENLNLWVGGRGWPISGFAAIGKIPKQKQFVSRLF
jgi:exo-beta-1,3-glucanase (GH17 family)